jgi:hypothetical protein
VQIVTGEWHDYSGMGDIVRDHELHIAMANPIWPSLKLVMRFREQKDMPGESALITMNQFLNNSFVISTKELEILKNLRPDLDNQEQWTWYATPNDELLAPIAKPIKFEKTHEIVRNNQYEIAWDGEFPVYSGFDKTAFIEVKRVELKGLLDKPVIVDNPKAMAYGPAHHNFAWEYIVDLSYASGLSDRELQALMSKYGRFIIAKKDNSTPRIIGLHEDGSLVDLGESI